MKSSYARPLLAVFLALSLAACDSGNGSESPTDGTSTGGTSTERETDSPAGSGDTAGGLAPDGYPSGPPNYPSAPGADLRIWVHSDGLLVEPVKEAIKKYEEASGAQVTVVVDDDWVGMLHSLDNPTYDVLITQLLPQVVWRDYAEIVDYQGQEDRFYPAALDLLRVGEDIYGVPFNVEMPIMIRNTTYIPEAPETWDELVNSGGPVNIPPLLIQKSPNALATLGTSFGVNHAPPGSTMEEIKAHGLTLDNAEAYAGWVQENITAGNIQFTTFFDGRIKMAEGLAKAIIGTPVMAEALLQTDRTTYEVTPIPQIGDEPITVTTTGPGAFIVKGTDKKEAAQDLIFNYLTTDDFLIDFGWIFMPATYSANVKYASISPLAQAARALDRATPVLVGAPDGWVWSAWEDLPQAMISTPEKAHDIFMQTMEETDDVLRNGRPKNP